MVKLLAEAILYDAICSETVTSEQHSQSLRDIDNHVVEQVLGGNSQQILEELVSYFSKVFRI
jgi:hypothetical protein